MTKKPDYDHYRESMTEAQMLKAIKDYAQAEGGYAFHVRDARAQDLAGLPDVIVFIPRSFNHPACVGFFELKTQSDKITSLQRNVLAVAGQAQEVVVGVVRPNPRGIAEMSLDDALESLGKEPWS